MLHITESIKNKLQDRGVNLLAFNIIPFQCTKICIILTYKENFFECKMHSDSLDIDYYNSILFCQSKGILLNLEQTKSFFKTETLFQTMKKRFPNHFKT